VLVVRGVSVAGVVVFVVIPMCCCVRVALCDVLSCFLYYVCCYSMHVVERYDAIDRSMKWYQYI
jgi:hypothetical protein